MFHSTMRLQGLYKYHQYQVVGRHLPTEKDANPPVFRMKLWAEDSVRAKSKFWYAGLEVVMVVVWGAGERDGSCVGRRGVLLDVGSAGPEQRAWGCCRGGGEPRHSAATLFPHAVLPSPPPRP